MSTLGSIFLDEETANDPNCGAVLSTLKADEFYHERHRLIYRAMLETRQRGEPIDAITVCYTLEQHKALEQVGTATYIRELVDAVPTALHIGHYAKIIKEMAFKRLVASRAVEIAGHAYNGVSAEALTGEVERLFSPEALSGSGSAFTLIKKKIEGFSWKQLTERRALRQREWVVDGWLARKEISMWSGKVETGKTTTIRECVLNVIRGGQFLERDVMLGKVTYVMLDADGEDGTYDEFEKLGLTEDDTDRIDFIFEPTIASMPRPMEQLAERIIEFGSSLVVIDPFARLSRIDDFKGYEATYLMAKLSELAKRTNAHLILVSHIPRGRSDNDDVATAAFGSIAFSGGVNARFVQSKNIKTNIRTFRSSNGKGGGFRPLDGERILKMDEDTHRVMLGGLYDWKVEADRAKEPLLRFLNANPDKIWTAAELRKELTFSENVCRTAANALFGEQKINRFGKGKKSSPYEYASWNYAEQSKDEG
jgi:hypothetical protein